MINSPASLIGITFNTAPFSSQTCCQGKILEWCSIDEIKISSPFVIYFLPNEVATRFIESVVPFVKIIS